MISCGKPNNKHEIKNETHQQIHDIEHRAGADTYIIGVFACVWGDCLPELVSQV